MQKYSEDLTLAHEYYREQDYKNCLKVYDILFHKGEQLSIGNLKEYAISLQKNMRYFESIEIARKILDKKKSRYRYIFKHVHLFGKNWKIF